ncbi:response regulator [Desulfosarcina cetonica]|uniref:response regulator n=1 Tax=Desulfosarcina cetonica TaxID=90730 RepID=UPI000A7C9CA0|nr:response regulator [Desulfosarcina cetonica]
MSRFANLFLDSSTATDTTAAVADPSEAPQAYRILFVDDEINVLKSMRRIFRHENYEVITAGSGPEALALLDKHQPVHVIISDHRMPGMTGTELLKQIKAKYPKTIRIMLTGYADTDAVMGAVNEGAVYKFITKPWNDDDLRLTVSLALEQYDLIRENTSLKQQAENQQKELKRLSRFINTHHSQLGNILVKAGLIDGAVLEKALSIQAKSSGILPKILVNIGAASEKAIIAAIEHHTDINRVSPAEFSVPEALAALVPREICEQNILMPLKRSDQKLIVVMADPTDQNKIDDLTFITGMPIQPVVASRREILEKIKETYGEAESFEIALSEIDLSDPTEQIEIILDETDEPPTSRS